MTLVTLIRHMQHLARGHGKRIFTSREISLLSGESRFATGMTLTRGAAKGLVSHVGIHWLNLLDPPELSDVAMTLESPSYMSFESALYHHGILSQSPRAAMTMATTRRPSSRRTPIGTIRYFHLGTALFFGYDEDRMALPEKAWLDLLYLRGLKGRSNPVTEEIDTGRLDRKLLRRMSLSFPPWVGDLALGNPGSGIRDRGPRPQGPRRPTSSRGSRAGAWRTG